MRGSDGKSLHTFTETTSIYVNYINMNDHTRKHPVFVWIHVWGFIISYRSYIGNSYRAYLELVTVHRRIIAFVVTVYLQCSYRVTLRNFAPFIHSYTNASNDIIYFPLFVIRINHIYIINKPLTFTKLQINEFERTNLFQLRRRPPWYRNGNFSYRPSVLGVLTVKHEMTTLVL